MNDADVQNFYYVSTIKFTDYWVDFIDGSPNSDEMVLEQENLLLAFRKAVDFGVMSMALRIHSIYDFFVDQGLHTNLKNVLRYIDQNLAEIDDVTAIAKNYEKLGKTELLLENFDEARTYFIQGLELANQANLVQQIGIIEYEFAKLEFEAHRYDESNKLLQSALTKAENASNLHGYCSILADLGKNAYFQDDYDKVKVYCQLALPIAEEQKFYETIAALYSCLGITEYSECKLEQAYTTMLKGLWFARRSDETVRINNLLTNLGSLATELGYLDDAILHLEEALNLSIQIGSTGYMAHILMDLGLAKYKVGEREEGVVFMDESVATAKEFDDWSLYMHVLRSRAEHFMELKLFQSAVLDWETILTLETPFNDRVKGEFARAHWNLTTAYDALDQQEKAAENAHKSLELYKTLESPEQDKVAEWLDARG